MDVIALFAGKIFFPFLLKFALQIFIELILFHDLSAVPLTLKVS